MIVLDEQLLGRQLQPSIAAWYRGAVCSVTDLRPGTLIRDDAIPTLLAKQRQPSFITINISHFWRRTRADRRFCIVCFKLLDRDVPKISDLLRLLLRNRNFSAKAQRAGYVFRVNLDEQVQFYNYDNEDIQHFQL
ncbi:MAG: hypothetical protein ACOYXY_19035 [Thermodesulfobacteriota bacterium]